MLVEQRHKVPGRGVVVLTKRVRVPAGRRQACLIERSWVRSEVPIALREIERLKRAGWKQIGSR